MSGSNAGTKEVKFTAKTKPSVKKALKTTVAPNQVIMAPDGKDTPGTIRDDDELADTPLRDPTAVDEQFPTDSLSASDPRDVVMTQKMELQKKSEDANHPGVTPFGVLTATEDDLEWVRSKREKELDADFMRWFIENFDKMSPEQKAFAREMYPKLYEERMRLADKQLKLAKKIVDLKINGMRTKEDLMLQYAMEAGFVDTDPISNILHPEKSLANKNEKRRQDAFRRGLLNPKRLPRGDWGPWKRSQNAMDTTGRSASAFGNNKPYHYGTEGRGFSAIGNATTTSEKKTNWQNTVDFLNMADVGGYAAAAGAPEE